MRAGPRSRRRHGGRWRVFARVERFTEPALLLLLRERPAHGYDLLERLENYQRDLEEELADVADLIAHLRDAGDQPAPQQTAEV